MATAAPPIDLRPADGSTELARQWRTLTRAATFVAILTSPAAYLFLSRALGWNWRWALVGALVGAAAFRGLVDVAMRKFIPWPSLFGTDQKKLRDEDILARRRAWFWRRWVRWTVFFIVVVTVIWFVIAMFQGFDDASWVDIVSGAILGIPALVTLAGPYLLFLPLLLLMNFVILFGPLLLMAVSQIQSFEPGDADWGVKLEDVRGQAEVKEEVRRVVSLWQSGEKFEAAGGKRERGLLFLGAPGTGKTMLSKAIATGFNAPFVSIPGSGFAQTFIGMDAVTVRWLAWKAKRLARKWGGQCIVFIDEIDAVGMRRHTLGHPGGGTGMGVPRFEELSFYGPWGSLTSSGDLILENRIWRDRLFAERAAATRPAVAGPFSSRLGGIVNQAFPGMMGGGGGGLALNQLLVVMDGIGNPRFSRKHWTKGINTLLDAVYVVPQQVGRVRLRLKPAPPAPEQIYFIGACNVPIDSLDPALTRAGRMGRHVWFRTPTKQDRLDVFDLYLGRVDHDESLDGPARRDELARITMGYSPAMIEQVCSIALTYAHHTGRDRFAWEDLVEAMATVESGTAQNIEYVASETRAVAIHEAGHAAAAHVYMPGVESTRISIRRRGDALGHHQAFEKEERFSRWRHEEIGALIWTLGAMAAERVIYGENSNGVGGDVQSATARAAYMVGASAMGPLPLDDETDEEARERIMKRFEQIGVQIMGRTSGGGPMSADPIASVLSDKDKRTYAAQLLGQAYVTAHNLMAANRDKVERIADEIVARREIYGDDLIALLDRQQLEAPTIDYEDEKTWPKI